MSNCMIIPTYWSTPEIMSWNIFDHPISVAEEGSLGQTLDNLEKMNYPDPVILFPSPMNSVIEAKVKAITAERSIDIRIFTDTDLKQIISALKKNGFPEDLLQAVHLDSYGGVRNIGLLYAAIHGFDNVVMIDDDECIDENYHSKALRYMGTDYKGTEILGKTGCVIDEDGRKFYDGQASYVLENWPKDALFNENVKKELEAEDPLSPCTVAFGGNMVINRKMFLQVPFDPYGTRGEDDDYVLNARYCGLPFFFDQDLLLLHLPPKRKGSYWTRQRQDILRFKYLREKVRLFGFDPQSLGTFIEHFTQDDLEYKAVSSSVLAALHHVDIDRNEFNEFLNNAILSESISAGAYRATAETFIRFLHAWQEVVPRI
ncbi:hypothetical protein [Oceanispirochaeta sp.]|jgi:GT2 family glycosyltransferase|uniref:hypothetical protein n=1 Tax=Oceanispirochaeta sp. TaxID=2035350 RepID=UPI002620F9A1|nr:hypothetical protein [Oceanispirochaeta sp.]MDA3956573.1 hypothetical protein [Oceanispirochaeta sp.]